MIVASIVLSWNGRDDTLRSLRALREQRLEGLEHRLLLVDNGSTDGTVEAVTAALPETEILRLPENVGFAAGMNAGIDRALDGGADWTLLVNNDTEARAGMLARLVEAGAGERIGMTAPTVYELHRPERVWPSAGRRRRLTLAAFDTTADPPSTEPYDVDWATGCCLLVRGRLWREVGLFDLRYRFYYEDHDLCLRARAAGWRIVHVPRAAVGHRVAASTGEGSPRQMYLLARASVPYYLRHTRGAHRALIVAYRIGSLARTEVECLASGRAAAARAYATGLRDGLRDVGLLPGTTRDWDPMGAVRPG